MAAKAEYNKQDTESTRSGEDEVMGVVAEPGPSDALPPSNATAGPSSFAPKGFVFEAPAGGIRPAYTTLCRHLTPRLLVEDVFRKFDALKEAEARCWVEEHKPPPRRKKIVKKPPPAAAPKAGTNVEAKSRLAAVKAAMKAKQQAAQAEKAAQVAGEKEDNPSIQVSEAPTVAQVKDTVVFNGGFFKVESPAKQTGEKVG